MINFNNSNGYSENFKRLLNFAIIYKVMNKFEDKLVPWQTIVSSDANQQINSYSRGLHTSLNVPCFTWHKTCKILKIHKIYESIEAK